MQLIAVLHAPALKIARPPRVRIRKRHPFGTWPGCQQTGPKVTPSEIPTTPGTVAAAIGDFVAEKRGMGRSMDTLQNYRRQLAKFTAYLHRQGLGELETRNLTKDVVRGYLADCRTNGMPHPTLALGANILKIWLHWAEEVGLVPDDLTYRLKMPTARPVTIEPLSMDQIRALVEATEQSRCPERDRAILMVMADTGVRASELCGMKDADLRDDRVRVFGTPRSRAVRSAWAIRREPATTPWSSPPPPATSTTVSAPAPRCSWARRSWLRSAPCWDASPPWRNTARSLPSG